VEQPKPIVAHVTIPHAMDLQVFMFALLGFCHTLVQSLLSLSPFLLIVRRMFTVGHSIIEICNLVFYFTGAHN
jgi:hypothetical protein